ncbi:response regulator transcription factor [Dokdonella sp. MW10]|uniref:response regulator transcription factor n=1 Tax=Dokdonella sp. MW10 TaxID=2992926 RepID=UPI003F7DE635
MPRILIVDDHPLFRLALAQAVRNVVDAAEVVEADGFEAAMAQLRAQPDTDLVLLDLHMPGSHGLMGLVTLRSAFPAVAVVMVSAHDDPNVVHRALTYGAAGFVPKRTGLDDLQGVLRAILDGELPAPPPAATTADDLQDRALAARLATLSPQQLRVLVLVAEGLLNKQIADRLGIQERTVKAHLTAIFERLGVRNRTQASLLLGALSISDPARFPLPDDTSITAG